MALQQSEKRLMALLLVALIGVANVIGYTVLEDKKKKLKDLQITHVNTLENYKFLKKTKVEWEQKRDFLTEIHSSHNHSGHPEKDNVRPGNKILSWVEFFQIISIIRPA